MFVQFGKAVTVLAIFAIVPAQGNCQRKHGDAFFQAMREAQELSPTKEILEMLRYDRVREHLGLTEENSSDLRQHAQSAWATLRELSDEFRGQKIPNAEMRDRIVEAMKPFDESTKKLLESKGIDYQRIVELFVQSRGYSAAANSEIAGQIGLDEEGLKKFRHKMDEYRDRYRRSAYSEIRKAISEDEHGKVRDAIRSIERRVNMKLKLVLTPEQQKALDQLAGTPVPDIPKFGDPHRFGSSGRSSGGRPPGGRPPGSKRNRGFGGRPSGESETPNCPPNCL